MLSIGGIHEPVTATEAVRAFQQLWKVGGGRINFMRLGFAISGGVDSMALAYLWSRIRLNKSGYNPYVRGFVVDHGLRPGSAEEAQLVASRLEPLLGRPGQIITLNWTKHGDSLRNKSNIETIVRKLRYQALAVAAKDCQLQCLVLGHHADDAVETTLFRLTTGGQGYGVSAAKSLSNIPECHGQFGISESGSFARLQSHQHLEHYVGGPEEGGIKLARPLSTFPKSRLIATCRMANIEWIEDESNQNLSLTPRNVIRNMLQTDVLPRALRQPSIMDFSGNILARHMTVTHIAARLHEATYIKSLDLRSGVLDVWLPEATFLQALVEEIGSIEPVQQAFVGLWKNLVTSVSPIEMVQRTVILAPANALFHAILDGDKHAPKLDLSGTGVAAVTLSPLTSKDKPMDNLGLRLYRCQYRRSSRPGTDIPKPFIFPSTLWPAHRSLLQTTRLEDFILWDGRFWICIQNHSLVPLRLVHLDETMLSSFRNSIQGIGARTIEAIFKEAAPGTSRFQLPAIVCDGRPPEASMIVRTRKREAYIPKESDIPLEFQIYKYCNDVLAKKSHPPDRVKHIPRSVLNPDLFRPEDNLARRPQSERRLIQLPPVTSGRISPEDYIVPEAPFVVALPTLELFLNSYWAKHLRYDIRYKKIPLEDMQHVSRFRLEKPITTPSHPLAPKLPQIVSESDLESGCLHQYTEDQTSTVKTTAGSRVERNAGSL